MKKQRKKYEKPVRPWDKVRLEKEREILKKYGLKNKKEIWRAEALLRNYRRTARELSARANEEKEKSLIQKLVKLGMLSENANLDGVLSLTIENILDRRLQAIVFKKGFANSAKQARQLITHGHIVVNGRKIVYPSYLVPSNEENIIQPNIVIQLKKVIE
jgi:small subunit ribosomal protein S4